MPPETLTAMTRTRNWSEAKPSMSSNQFVRERGEGRQDDGHQKKPCGEPAQRAKADAKTGCQNHQDCQGLQELGIHACKPLLWERDANRRTWTALDAAMEGALIIFCCHLREEGREGGG